MFYYLDTESQIKRISKTVDLLADESNRVNQNGLLIDFTDGTLYKNLLDNDIGEFIKRKEAFTITLNTDGISLSDNSTMSIWPVYGVINEIKPQERFCINNVIIIGIYLLSFYYTFRN